MVSIDGSLIIQIINFLFFAHGNFSCIHTDPSDEVKALCCRDKRFPETIFVIFCINYIRLVVLGQIGGKIDALSTTRSLF